MEHNIRRCLPVIGSILLISFLSLSSQSLFYWLEPGPLLPRESVVFNLLVATVLICYARSCSTNPGIIPKLIHGADSDHAIEPRPSVPNRWCNKCENVKPARSHHCKNCKRCVPKMDHHCIWIANCVSIRVFPHFLRFLFYSVVATVYLESFILVRVGVLWTKRHLPSYLGPTVWQLLHLFLLTLVNSATLFAIAIIFIRSAWGLATNITTIEGWEIERHEALLRRARASGGQLYGPNGIVVKIEKCCFPYDIGIWRNTVQGMGTRNVLSWFFPFSSSMPMDSGWSFETNGFDFPPKTWPPPDPDRIPNLAQRVKRDEFLAQDAPDFSQPSEVDAFRKRQLLDLDRKNAVGETLVLRKPPADQGYILRNHVINQRKIHEVAQNAPPPKDANEGWRNAEGERLDDFGVDEETELLDDDIPLAELVAKR